MRINQAEVASLSEFMHDNYHRCGGFVAHDSLAEAELYTEQLATVKPRYEYRCSYLQHR